MGLHTIAVPSLDDLIREPASAANLPRKARAVLTARAAALLASLASAEIESSSDEEQSSNAIERWLDDQEACNLMRVDRPWLVRHRNGLPFARRLSRKRWIYNERGIGRWLASRRAS